VRTPVLAFFVVGWTSRSNHQTFIWYGQGAPLSRGERATRVFTERQTAITDRERKIVALTTELKQQVDKASWKSPLGQRPAWTVPRILECRPLLRPQPLGTGSSTLDSLQGLGKEVARTEGPTGQSPWSISPEGTRIAIALKNGVRILDLANRTERNLKLPRRIWSLGWAPDDNALFAAVQSADYLLVRIGLDDQTSVLLDRGRNQWLAYAWPSPDGRYLAFSQQSFDSNVWLLEDF